MKSITFKKLLGSDASLLAATSALVFMGSGVFSADKQLKRNIGN